jgi:L-ribulokinase
MDKKNINNLFTLGLDYGTNSVRALVVNTKNGKITGSGVFNYPNGRMGILMSEEKNHLARQNPSDYIDGFVYSSRFAIYRARKSSCFKNDKITGIGISTTGSSVLPTNVKGVPLAMLPRYSSNLSASVWLWKDHTSFFEAGKITTLINKMQLPYLDECGGIYSPEWFWAKILNCAYVAPTIFRESFSWIEICDFIPAYVSTNFLPNKVRHSICAAGHKAMFNNKWNGLPSEAFLTRLLPELKQLRNRLYKEVFSSDNIAGYLSEYFAIKIGINSGIPITIGAFDIHHGAIGMGVAKNTLVKTVGTSTCDIMISKLDKPLSNVKGICGMIKGSVIPNMVGIESGQSAVGDILNWFVKNFYLHKSSNEAHNDLSKLAKKLFPGESGLIGLDWNNGNRTILSDHLLTGVILGQTLHTSSKDIYRALIESTGFGALAIINHIKKHSMSINKIICSGGIAYKNSLMMQIYSDIFNCPIQVSVEEQSCALGSSIFASVISNNYNKVTDAQSYMVKKSYVTYFPIPKFVRIYNRLNALYLQLHDNFCNLKHSHDLSFIMKNLLKIKKCKNNM